MASKKTNGHDPDLEPIENALLFDTLPQFVLIPTKFIDNSADLTDTTRWLFVLLRALQTTETATLQKYVDWSEEVIKWGFEELESAGWIRQEGGKTWLLRK